MHEKVKKIVPSFASLIALCTVGAISAHFAGLEYGILIGYLLGRVAGEPLEKLVAEKIK